MRIISLFALSVVACGFSPGLSSSDAPPSGPDASHHDAEIPDSPVPLDAFVPQDAPSCTGTSLQCGLHATCEVIGNVPQCKCDSGYTGIGSDCTAIDACATANGGCGQEYCTSSMGSATCHVAATCADLAGFGDSIPGTGADVTLFWNGDSSKPWTAFCSGGGSGGLEYLELGATSNFGQYSAGGHTSGQADGGGGVGSNVTTTFTKVRIVPATAVLDIADLSYATSVGKLYHPNTGANIKVTSMPFGVAMDCNGNNPIIGVANIDVSNTQFTIDVTQFVVSGAAGAGGGTTPATSTSKQIAITGGGNCGWNAPNGAPGNPFNPGPSWGSGGQVLSVTYSP